MGVFAALLWRLDTTRMSRSTVTAPKVAPAFRNERRAGLLAALGAFLLWGLFPLYLRAISSVPPLQVIAHRIVWCSLFVVIWLALRRELPAVRAAFATRAVVTRLAASAVLISINWLVYVWAVGHGHVVDASLGYFINPLVSVLLGVVVLRERLNPAQMVAVGMAATGVLYLTIVLGRLPWIALSLAFSFGLYGLIRKVVAVEAVPGMAVETLLLTPLAGIYLLWVGMQGIGAFGHSTVTIDALLVVSGLATAVPLSLFSFGARRIPLSTIGLIQYVGPTLQLLLGVTVFAEPFPAVRAGGFVLIWLALAVYAADGLLRSRSR
jgi:chloramphenicol-sensitive protein RarD